MSRRNIGVPLLLAAIAAASLFAARPAPALAEDSATDGPPALAQLQSQVQELIDASGLDIAVAFTDLQTGETAGVGIDQPRLTGCTINLLVLIQTTLDMQDGLLAMDDADWLVAETIYYSDASLARDLLFLIGGGDLGAGIQRVVDLAQRLGLSSAVYDHPPGFEDEGVAQVDNTMTPADMNRLLGMLWRGEILAPEWTAYLLGRMADVSPSLQYLIAGGVGEGATVMHKNGFYITDDGYGYVDNDAGIVTVETETGSYSYALSFFSFVADGEGEIGPGQKISALVWGYFEAKYGAPSPLARAGP